MSFGGSLRNRRRRPWRAASLLASLAALVSAATLLIGSGIAVPASSSQVPDGGPTRPVVGAHNDTTTPFNLVSLPALFDHPPNGRNFQITGRLVRTTDWTRYAVTYRGDELQLTGTLTLPNRSGRSPLIVVAHGYADARDYRRGDGQKREEAAFASAGYAVLHPDYRNYAGSSHEGSGPVAEPLGYPSDVINAIEALHKADLPRIDWDRVGLLGRSMGGGVALQVAEARPHWFRAIALYSPVSSWAADNYTKWVLPDKDLRQRVVRSYGTPTTRPRLWRTMSSRHYLARIVAPVLINHGTGDPVTAFTWSAATARALRAQGKDVQLIAYPGEAHRFTRQWPRLRDNLLAFFGRTLTPARRG